LLIQTRFRASR